MMQKTKKAENCRGAAEARRLLRTVAVDRQGWSRAPHMPPKLHMWAQNKKKSGTQQSNTDLQMMKR